MYSNPEKTRDELRALGIDNCGDIFHNLSIPELVEHAVVLGEGTLTEHGALLVNSAPYTGRRANDKFIVDEPSSSSEVWWGKVNKPFSKERFTALKSRVFAYLQGRDVYVQDLVAGSDPRYALHVRFVQEYAYHSHFVRNMFIVPEKDVLENFQPGFTVITVPEFKSAPEIDGTLSEVFIIVDFSENLVLIGGTSYAGENKKSIFTVLNYLLPRMGVMSMHCSSNIGEEGDTALFFGLSGTGKTTLSADPHRALIGDDEHGWSDEGVFNFEGGCYAKVINLSREAEPIIFSATEMFGTILENVVMDSETRRINLFSQDITENTRASYAREAVPNIVSTNRGGHPANVVFLTADAFGVMPPIARLTPEQLMYHFLSGYTAKVAGTETGVKEPTATFSACFGAPFMVLHPGVYARLLADKVKEHNARVWLVNTGWTGGPYGVGSRMKIAYTRAMLHAAIHGDLEGIDFVKDPFFNLNIPVSCPGVPKEVLDPKNTWSDKSAYDLAAKKLVDLFRENFKQFAHEVDNDVVSVM